MSQQLGGIEGDENPLISLISGLFDGRWCVSLLFIGIRRPPSRPAYNGLITIKVLKRRPATNEEWVWWENCRNVWRTSSQEVIFSPGGSWIMLYYGFGLNAFPTQYIAPALTPGKGPVMFVILPIALSKLQISQRCAFTNLSYTEHKTILSVFWNY